MNEIIIEIPKYIRKVQLSEKRNKKFYEAGKKKLPKKYQDITKYQWRTVILSTGTKKIRLFDMKTKQPVIANPRAAGTPRHTLINGQDIYNGKVGKWTRAKVVTAIKEDYTNKLYDTKLSISDFPLHIRYDFYDNLSELSDNKDLDNHAYLYAKCFQDFAQDIGILKKDNINFVRGIEYRYFPIEDTEQRKITITITKML